MFATILMEGLSEGGGKIIIVPCVGLDKIGLGGRHIPRVEEAVDCGRRLFRNGGSGGSACHQDDALGHWLETVAALGLLFRLALGKDDGAERFCGVQPGRHVGHDAHETHVVLWNLIGRRGEVDICPMTEPDAHACPREGRMEPQ